jgi:hypothetical protein
MCKDHKSHLHNIKMFAILQHFLHKREIPIHFYIQKRRFASLYEIIFAQFFLEVFLSTLASICRFGVFVVISPLRFNCVPRLAYRTRPSFTVLSYTMMDNGGTAI